MNFTYDLENIKVDDCTGDVLIPIKVDSELDSCWCWEMIDIINGHNKKNDHYGIICLVRVSLNLYLELHVRPCHQNAISQKTLDDQKKLISDLSACANYSLLQRIEEKDRNAKKLNEDIQNSNALIQKLKGFEG